MLKGLLQLLTKLDAHLRQMKNVVNVSYFQQVCWWFLWWADFFQRDLGSFAPAKVGGKDLSATQKYPGSLGLRVLWLFRDGGEGLVISQNTTLLNVAPINFRPSQLYMRFLGKTNIWVLKLVCRWYCTFSQIEPAFLPTPSPHKLRWVVCWARRWRTLK